jgi:hypothetical protein
VRSNVTIGSACVKGKILSAILIRVATAGSLLRAASFRMPTEGAVNAARCRIDIFYGLKLTGAGKGPEPSQAYLKGLDGAL